MVAHVLVLVQTLALVLAMVLVLARVLVLIVVLVVVFARYLDRAYADRRVVGRARASLSPAGRGRAQQPRPTGSIGTVIGSRRHAHPPSPPRENGPPTPAAGGRCRCRPQGGGAEPRSAR